MFPGLKIFRNASVCICCNGVEGGLEQGRLGDEKDRRCGAESSRERPRNGTEEPISEKWLPANGN